MEVVWVGGTTFATQESATSITAAAPSGLDDGDTLLAAVFGRSTLTTPSGWTKILEAGPITEYAGITQYFAVFSKNSVTTSDASASFTFAQGSSGRIGIVFAAVRGNDVIAESAQNTALGGTIEYADEFDEVGTNVSWRVFPPSLTATSNDGMLIVFVSCVYTETTMTPAPQSGFTLFSGASGQYRLAGAYRSVDTGQSNSGHFDFDTSPDSAVANGFGAITIRLAAAGAPLIPEVESYASAPAVLRAPQAVAKVVAAVRCSAPGIFANERITAEHDFTAFLVSTPPRYEMVLTTPDGTVTAPISSWQATLQTVGQNYLQAVVPAVLPWLDAINAASEFAVYRLGALIDGRYIRYLMAQASLDTPQFAQGPQNYTCTLAGYSRGFEALASPPATLDRELQGVRSVFSSPGSFRVRCEVDWSLRPGRRAVYQGTPFVVSFINYYALQGDHYMDVGQRIEPGA